MKPTTTLFLALLIILSSCTKDPEKPAPSLSGPDAIKFSRDALAYVKLIPGKYLIYKDSATSSQDSVVVTTSLLSTEYVPASSDAIFSYRAHTLEQFDLVLTAFTDSGQLEWFNGHAEAFCYLNNNCNSASVDLMEGGSMAFEGVDGYPSNLSVVIEGKTYNNVIIHDFSAPVDINAPSYVHYVHNIYYWAKGVGIIKRTNITTGGAVKTYTLLRNN